MCLSSCSNHSNVDDIQIQRITGYFITGKKFIFHNLELLAGEKMALMFVSLVYTCGSAVAMSNPIIVPDTESHDKNRAVRQVACTSCVYKKFYFLVGNVMKKI